MKGLNIANAKVPLKLIPWCHKVWLHIVCAKSFIIKYTLFVLLPLSIYIVTLGYDDLADFYAVKKVKITSNSSHQYLEERTMQGARGGGTETWTQTKTYHAIGCKLLDEPERSCRVDMSLHPNRYGIGQVMTTGVILSRGPNKQGWIWSTTMTAMLKVWLGLFALGALWVWLGASGKTFDFKIRKCDKDGL